MTDRQANKRVTQRLFWAVAVAKLAVIVGVSFAVPGWVHDMSRDSLTYHWTGETIATDLAAGTISITSLEWMDEAWFSVTGVLYYLTIADPLVIQLLNVILSALAAVLVYLIGCQIYSSHVAKVGAYAGAFLPSLFYWTLLPLKEAWAMMAIALMVYATLGLKAKGRVGPAVTLVIGIVLVGMVRLYLAAILAGLAGILLIPETVRRRRTTLSALIVRLAVALVIFVAIYFILNVIGVTAFSDTKLAYYFDVDNLNKARSGMSHGEGAMFAHRDADLGEEPITDVFMLVAGVFYFFFSVNPIELRSSRQLAALPELILFLFALPALLTGIVATWREKAEQGFVVLAYAMVIMAVYSLMATNMGAMYRWRIQALPLFILIAAFGAYRKRRGFLYQVLRAIFGGEPDADLRRREVGYGRRMARYRMREEGVR